MESDKRDTAAKEPSRVVTVSATAVGAGRTAQLFHRFSSGADLAGLEVSTTVEIVRILVGGAILESPADGDWRRLIAEGRMRVPRDGNVNIVVRNTGPDEVEASAALYLENEEPSDGAKSAKGAKSVNGAGGGTPRIPSSNTYVGPSDPSVVAAQQTSVQNSMQDAVRAAAITMGDLLPPGMMASSAPEPLVDPPAVARGEGQKIVGVTRQQADLLLRVLAGTRALTPYERGALSLAVTQGGGAVRFELPTGLSDVLVQVVRYSRRIARSDRDAITTAIRASVNAPKDEVAATTSAMKAPEAGESA